MKMKKHLCALGWHKKKSANIGAIKNTTVCVMLLYEVRDVAVYRLLRLSRPASSLGSKPIGGPPSQLLCLSTRVQPTA